LGYFLYNSDICLANLDEPLDPGVIVEMIFAKMMGKHIIGYRTEMRTTFG
jgi:nucleoside 2-deoxyribosyltransferase